MLKSSIVSLLASARQCNFISLPLNFVCMFLIAFVAKISVNFNNYSPHPKPPVFSSSYVCVLHDEPTHCCLVFTEAAMKISLIELPYGEHMSFNAPLDHGDLILLQNFRNAHVHYAT